MLKKYLIIDSKNINVKKYKSERYAAFNDWFNEYIEVGSLTAKEIFEKYNIPKKYEKLIFKINRPLFNKAIELNSNFKFNAKKNKKEILVSSGIECKDSFSYINNRITCNTTYSFIDKKDILIFMKDLQEKGMLENYLNAICEILDCSVNDLNKSINYKDKDEKLKAYAINR